MRNKFHAVFNITKGCVSLYQDVSQDPSRMLLKRIREPHFDKDISDTSKIDIESEKGILSGLEWFYGLEFGNDLENVSMYWIISPSF